MMQSLQRLPPAPLVRIVYERFPMATGIYPLIHAGDFMVFWQTPNGLTYAGIINAIIETDDYPTYHVYQVNQCPPFEEYGK